MPWGLLPNASWQELGMAVFGACGVAFNLWCLWQAFIDAWKVVNEPADPLVLTEFDMENIRRVVIARLRSEFVRAFLQSFLLWLAIVGVFYPPAAMPEAHTLNERQLRAWFWITWIRHGLTACIIGLTLNSFLNTVERHAMIASIRQRRQRR